MRIFARWTARFVLAATAGIAIAVTGAGSAHAEAGTPTDTPPAATTNAPIVRADNFPWG